MLMRMNDTEAGECVTVRHSDPITSCPATKLAIHAQLYLRRPIRCLSLDGAGNNLNLLHADDERVHVEERFEDGIYYAPGGNLFISLLNSPSSAALLSGLQAIATTS